MTERIRRSRTTIAAGVLMLALTAAFWVLTADLYRNVFGYDAVDRETYLTAIGLGLNPEMLRNLLTVSAVVLTITCTLATVLAVGVLLLRSGSRMGAIGTFGVFAAVTLPLAIVGIFSGDPPRGELVGFGVGALDAFIVWLLLRPETARDFELADRARDARRFERRARRRRVSTG